MSTDTATAYLRTTVMTAKPEQLRLMLLEGAVKFARQGREGLATKAHEQAFNGLTRARDIVVELMTSIRPDTDETLRQRVKGLYAFIFKQLVDASFEKDVTKVDEAIRLLEYEVETWKMAMEQAAKERAGGAFPRPTSPPPSAPAASAAPAQSARPKLSIQG